MYLSIKELNKHLPAVNGVHYKPFLFQDCIDIEGGEFEGYSAQRMVGVQKMLEAQAEYGFAFTCFLHGVPVACFGTSLLWTGVGEMWSIIGNEARKHPVSMTRIGISFADISQIAMGLHRLQITVKTSDNRAMKWARAIGFISEGTLKAYSMDKVDYDIMARRI